LNGAKSSIQSQVDNRKLQIEMFNQTFEPHDLFVIGVLIILEGVLSLDNALVLGLLARRLPQRLQPRALMYGLVGAFAFRVIAILLAGFLLSWRLPKLPSGLPGSGIAGSAWFQRRSTTWSSVTSLPCELSLRVWFGIRGGLWLSALSA